MALQGVEWAHSNAKRRLDVGVACALAPVSLTLEAAAPHLFGSTGHDRLETQKRVGATMANAAFSYFTIYKINTTDPLTGEPFNSLASVVQQTGVDEIAQWRNVARGDMSVAGHRPVLEQDLMAAYDEAGDGNLVDRHRKLVLPTRPGIVSSFGIASHTESPGERLELDIKDVLDGSFRYDMQLISQLIRSGMSRILKKSPAQDSQQ